MAVNDGSDIWVTIAGSLVNGLTEKSLNLSANEIDVTTQDSGEWTETAIGFKSGVLSFSGKDDESDTYGYDQLATAFAAGASVAFAYDKGIKTAGGRLITGNAVITGLDKSDSMDAAGTFTCNLKITGTPTFGTSSTTVA